MLDIKNWRKYKINVLFKVKRGKRILKDRDYFSKSTDRYCYPVITAKTSNNGVNGYYNEFNCKGNVLVCAGEASGMKTFYQPLPCWVVDSSRILIPKFKEFNKYIALFFIPILEKNMFRFCYGFSANPNDIGNIEIKLPVDKNNEPDWLYMKNYITLLSKNTWHNFSRLDVLYKNVQKQ